MLVNTKYNASFTTGALLLKEADALLMNKLKREGLALDLINLDFRVVPVNSEKSQKKLTSEVISRLNSINVQIFIPLFINGSIKDKNLILFYAACKSYSLISDFLLEKVLDKWYNMDYELTTYDFVSFIYKKSNNHPELESLTNNTIQKMSQVVLKMLNDVGLVTNNKLYKLEYNVLIAREIAIEGDYWFLQSLFLTEQEINNLMN